MQLIISNPSGPNSTQLNLDCWSRLAHCNNFSPSSFNSCNFDQMSQNRALSEGQKIFGHNQTKYARKNDLKKPISEHVKRRWLNLKISQINRRKLQFLVLRLCFYRLLVGRGPAFSNFLLKNCWSLILASCVIGIVSLHIIYIAF